MSFEDTAFMPIGDDEQLPKWPSDTGGSSSVVTAVGAWCDVERNGEMQAGRRYFPVRIDEFDEMSNGVRISIRWDRGVTVSWGRDDGGDEGLPEEELLGHLACGLLPDEGETEDAGELRSWHEYALLLRARGIAATAKFLRDLPYLTELSSGLSSLLTYTHNPPSRDRNDGPCC